MVIYYLSGGLGNQILQYAIGRGIASTRTEEMAYDASWYRMRKRKPHETLRLGEYQLRCEHISQKKLFQVLGTLLPEEGWKGPKWLYTAGMMHLYLYVDRIFHRRLWRGKREFDISKTGLKGLPAPNDELPGIVLYGCPFHAEYFHHIAGELREEFVPKRIDTEIMQMAKAMGENAVCIHVRVRDDGSIPDPAYYERAISQMQKRMENPHFYVFSNNADHAKKLLHLPENAIFVKPGDAVQDLYLMSQCHHHIIAESTYSWCGAWLGEKAGQIVMYPKGWEFEGLPLRLTFDNWIPIEGMRYMAVTDK